MNWFRNSLAKNRLFVFSVLLINLTLMVDMNNFVFAHQHHQSEEARIREISEILGIPEDLVRPEHKSIFASLSGLIGDTEDPVKVAGRQRLEESLRKHENEVARNPYRVRIEKTKQQQVVPRIEGLLQEIRQLTSHRLPMKSQAALLRNLHHGVQADNLRLPPLPSGLPSKARERNAALQAKLDELVTIVRPIVAASQGSSPIGTPAQKAEQVRIFQAVEIGKPERDQRIHNSPLPLRRVEKKAPLMPVAQKDLAQEELVPAATAANPETSESRAKSVAPEIAELAQELGHSPARIFTWVHDQISLGPKWGAFQSPIGVLWTRSGTAWEQAWLLQELLVAAGVDARLEWGQVQIDAATLRDIAGIDDAVRAGDLLATAGVPIVLLTEGSEVVAARLSHVWVKAFVDYIPNRGATPGPGDHWIRMDPSITRHDYAPGIRIHDAVPFSLAEYLTSGSLQSPRRAYEEAVWAHIQDQGIDCTNLEQLKPRKTVRAENFPFLPATLRAKILSIEGESSDLPPEFQAVIDVGVRRADGSQLMSWTGSIPDAYGQRLEIAWSGASTEDQQTLEAYGGVFETPPYLVDLVPVIRLDGVEQMRGRGVGSGLEIETTVTIRPPAASTEVFFHDGFAGEPGVVVTAFGEVPQQLVDIHSEHQRTVAVSGDASAVEAATLHLLGSTYFRNLGRDTEDIAGWHWQRLVRLVSEGLVVQTGEVSTTLDGVPLSFNKAETYVDFPGFVVGLFDSEGNASLPRQSLELVGSQGSYLEDQVFNEVIAREGIAAVTALARARAEGQAVQRVDAANLESALAAVELGDGVEAQIRFAIGQGRVAWIPESPLTVRQWRGVGYVLADPETGAAGFLLSGGFAGGADVGPAEVLKELLGEEHWWTNGPLKPLIDALLLLLNAFPTPEEPQASQGDPVNLATGNFWIRELDAHLPSPSIPVLWSRTYNSRSNVIGPLGYGWTHSYGDRLIEQPEGSILLREDDGSEHLFRLEPDGSFSEPPGKNMRLVRDATGFDLVVLPQQGRQRFNFDGRLLSISDPLGNLVTLAYDNEERLESVSDVNGMRKLSLEYADDKLIRVLDFSGRELLYGYEGDDLVSVRNFEGQTWSYAYDESHNMIERRNPLGTSDNYAYDMQDRMIRHTNRAGESEHFAYPQLGGSAVVTDTRGFDTYFELDPQGRALISVDPLGHVSRAEWDDDNNRTAYINGRGAAWRRTFGDSGRILEEVDPAGGRKVFTYDAIGRIRNYSEPGGAETTFDYDEGVAPIRVTRQAGDHTEIEEYAYNAFGQVISYRDPNGKVVEFKYHPVNGSLTEQNEPDGVERKYDLDDLGRVGRFYGSGSRQIHLVWSDQGRIDSITDAFGHTASAEYDALGRQTQITSSRGTIFYEYDSVDQLVRITDASGAATSFEYDSAGNRIATTDALGRRILTTYDALDRPISSVDSMGGVWTFGHCSDMASSASENSCRGVECGSAASPVSGGEGYCEVTDPLGHRVSREYDIMGRVTKVIDPRGQATEMEYDSAGRLTSVRDPLNRETEFEYDEIGRRTAIVEPV